MSPNHYIEDLRAERDALRAVVARVEALEGSIQRGEVGPLQQDLVAYLIRVALTNSAWGSTDSDPAATERQGEAGGAGDGV